MEQIDEEKDDEAEEDSNAHSAGSSYGPRVEHPEQDQKFEPNNAGDLIA